MFVGEVVLILTFGLDYRRRRSIREFDVVSSAPISAAKNQGGEMTFGDRRLNVDSGRPIDWGFGVDPAQTRVSS
jgi:hypothetical protein